MGADRVSLFNKALADQIIGLDSDAMIPFVIATDPEKVTHVFALYPGFEKVHSPDRLQSFIRTYIEIEGLTWLQWQLINELACDAEVVVDYWGCYAEVFCGHPAGSISSRVYFPKNQQEDFLLLLPEHIDLMLSSLRKHRNELKAMTEADLAVLDAIRQKCAEDEKFRAAYWFD